MLVLSRHRDESIQIGDQVTVLVVDVYGDKVKLGITAPRDMPVHRSEVSERIRQAQGGASVGESLRRSNEQLLRTLEQAYDFVVEACRANIRVAGFDPSKQVTAMALRAEIVKLSGGGS